MTTQRLPQWHAEPTCDGATSEEGPRHSESRAGVPAWTILRGFPIPPTAAVNPTIRREPGTVWATPWSAESHDGRAAE